MTKPAYIHYRASGKRVIIALIAAAFFSLGCNETPLLTELETTRLVIMLKGTYESNSPRPWGHTALGPDNAAVESGTINNVTLNGSDLFPTALMIDMAQMKLATSNKYHEFSTYRQTYISALNDSDLLFNGAGLMLQNDDAPAASYAAIGLYMRKMLFNNGTRYILGASGWTILPSADVFAEQVVPGVNFNQFMINSFIDSLRYEGLQINRVFPVAVAIDPFMYFNLSFPYTVIEVRIVIKNYFKKFEVVSYDQNGFFTVTHFWAPSDWKLPLAADDVTLGGNLVATARWYVPGLTGTIRGTVGGAAGQYVIAIPAGASIADYTIPASLIAARGSDATANCNMTKAPPLYYGSLAAPYIDYCLKTENWKITWNNRITGGSPCTSFEQYQSTWDSYSQNINRLKIAPVATWSATSTYVLENVMPGAYDLYRTNIPVVDVTYGNLFNSNNFLGGATRVNVSAGGVVTQNIP